MQSWHLSSLVPGAKSRSHRHVDANKRGLNWIELTSIFHLTGVVRSALHYTANCPHVDSAASGGGDDDDWLLVEVVSPLIYLFHGIDS